MYRFAATLVSFSMRYLARANGPELIDFERRRRCEDFPEVMRREIAATIVLKAWRDFAARFP